MKEFIFSSRHDTYILKYNSKNTFLLSRTDGAWHCTIVAEKVIRSGLKTGIYRSQIAPSFFGLFERTNNHTSFLLKCAQRGQQSKNRIAESNI